MPSAEVLDFAKLLAPIPGDAATGADLRADPSPVSLYQLIREDRKAARQAETKLDRGDTDPDLTLPDWRPLIEKSRKVLTEQSKDLEVVAYLIEGLTRVHGFAGVRDGFRLAAELIETYWDALYPSPGDTDIETRFSHLLQLNGIDSAGALIVPIAKIPFTERTDAGELSRVHYQEAQAVAKIADPKLRQSKAESGAITMEVMQRAVIGTPAGFFKGLVDDLQAARDQFQRFCAALREKSGYDPSSGNLLQALESYLDIVKDLARSKLQSGPPPPAASAPPSPNGGQPTADPASAPVVAVVGPAVGAIRSRNDALDALLRIADYFEEAEPQSVIPYALRQVVHWGQLSLPDLLSELITEDGPRKSLFKQVGIKSPEPPPKEAAKK